MTTAPSSCCVAARPWGRVEEAYLLGGVAEPTIGFVFLRPGRPRHSGTAPPMSAGAVQRRRRVPRGTGFQMPPPQAGTTPHERRNAGGGRAGTRYHESTIGGNGSEHRRGHHATRRQVHLRGLGTPPASVPCPRAAVVSVRRLSDPVPIAPAGCNLWPLGRGSWFLSRSGRASVSRSSP